MIKNCDQDLAMAVALAEDNDEVDDDFQQLGIRGSLNSQKIALKTCGITKKQNGLRSKKLPNRCPEDDPELKGKKYKKSHSCEEIRRKMECSSTEEALDHSEANNSLDAVVSASRYIHEPVEILKSNQCSKNIAEIATQQFHKETEGNMSLEPCILLNDELMEESNVSEGTEQANVMLEIPIGEVQNLTHSAPKDEHAYVSLHLSNDSNSMMYKEKFIAPEKGTPTTGYGSQMSALLRLCSLAVKEGKGMDKEPTNSPCTEDFTIDVDDSEDETDITSLMTQVTSSPRTSERKTLSKVPELKLEIKSRPPMQDITNSSKHVGRRYAKIDMEVQISKRMSQKQLTKVSKTDIEVQKHRKDLGNSGKISGTSTSNEEDKRHESDMHKTDYNSLGKENSTQDLQSDVLCPVCKISINDMAPAEREAHSNSCLDSLIDGQKEKFQNSSTVGDTSVQRASLVDCAPVVEWLNKLSLARYADIFIKEEIDWDTLKWIKEEDLITLGITALGPRRKIILAIEQLRNGECTSSWNISDENLPVQNVNMQEQPKMVGSKLITDFFKLPSSANRALKHSTSSSVTGNEKQRTSYKVEKVASNRMTNLKRGRGGLGYSGIAGLKEIPQWMCIPGTRFRVDAFRYLTGDCCHWFLTHFHTDHYQGLTKGFRYGKIYCSLITARLVNMRIGIPWDKLQPIPLNERVQIEGVQVIFLDANHCPGSVIILFELPNGKNILHTGDFRFCTEMANIPVLQKANIHTLMLDTTYCDPQYDFPKQEVVIQFVIDAIQAEAFNPKTLFLIGTYTIGKERLFLEVGKVLQRKVYIGAAKQRMLACMDIPKDYLQWVTSNDQESFIHVVPLWSIASFKRMNSISKHYHVRFIKGIIVHTTETIIMMPCCNKWSLGSGRILWIKFPLLNSCMW
ncbi:hypothetical protein O6H91_08G049800 [Diphasiastrum complanatum]|uniref:Uncharacterized protein n=1 Tax=Diphasiastrum complanatum TaxID=34168 RepID=A0ACC2CXM7_DIPCM|nr:hypothetical protein O6H91_08G049800 [Diphasiastrum complanatum]